MENLYFISRVKILLDGTPKAVETSFHNSLQSAQAKFHRNIGADMDDTTLSGSISVIIDSLGNRVEGYVWSREEEPTVTE